MRREAGDVQTSPVCAKGRRPKDAGDAEAEAGGGREPGCQVTQPRARHRSGGLNRVKRRVPTLSPATNQVTVCRPTMWDVIGLILSSP